MEADSILLSSFKHPMKFNSTSNLKRTDSYRFATQLFEPKNCLAVANLTDTSTDNDEEVMRVTPNYNQTAVSFNRPHIRGQSVAKVKLRNQKKKSLRQTSKEKCASVCENYILGNEALYDNRRLRSLEDLPSIQFNRPSLSKSLNTIEADDFYEKILAFNDEVAPVVKKPVKFINAHTLIDTNTTFNTDFIAQNSNFMGSPIHVLLKYQNSRRSLERNEESPPMKPETNKTENEINSLTQTTADLVSVKETRVTKSMKSKKKLKTISYYKDLIGIFISTTILFSSLLLLEIMSTLLLIEQQQQQKYFMIIFKLSSFLFNIALIIFISTATFTSNGTKRLTKITRSFLLTPNFSLLTLTLCFLYIYILLTQLISYFTSKSDKFIIYVSRFQLVSSILSGISYSLLILSIINYLSDISDLRNCGNLCSLIANAATSQQQQCNNRNNEPSSTSFVHKKYQITFLCYFVLYQTNLIYLAIVLLFLFYIIGEHAIIEQFGKLCLSSVNSLKLCPVFPLRDYLFENKDEIVSHIENVFARSQHVADVSNQTVQNANISTAIKRENRNDVYLLLFSLTLVNFIVSVLFAFLFIELKRNKTPQVTTTTKSEIKVVHDVECVIPLIKINDEVVTDNSKNEARSEYSFLKFFSILPLTLFHGFVKTFVIFELSKWYASCFRGPLYLAKSLLCYGFSSISGLLVLMIVYLVFNVKRSVLFALVFVQQLTLLILLLYWDPKSSEDPAHFTKDFIFIICFAICDNFWLLHNLNNLLLNAINLKNKPPMLILFYGYSAYSFGHTIGFTLSAYSCYTFKIYLSVFLFLISSLIYIIPEILKKMRFNKKN